MNIITTQKLCTGVTEVIKEKELPSNSTRSDTSLCIYNGDLNATKSNKDILVSPRPKDCTKEEYMIKKKLLNLRDRDWLHHN